mmetsp:Transcript_38969/g.77375  ORF Transcript_38969/g.77375 Transcript_38969/m.77375 type:complete len:210 (-) Transcript_38969:167-796(-)
MPGLQTKPCNSCVPRPSRPSLRLPPHSTTHSGTSRWIIHAGTSHSVISPLADLPPSYLKYLSIKSRRNDFPVRKAPITPTTDTFVHPVRLKASWTSASSSSPITTLLVSRSILTICSGLGRFCSGLLLTLAVESGSDPSFRTSATAAAGKATCLRRVRCLARRLLLEAHAVNVNVAAAHNEAAEATLLERASDAWLPLLLRWSRAARCQ